MTTIEQLLPEALRSEPLGIEMIDEIRLRLESLQKYYGERTNAVLEEAINVSLGQYAIHHVSLRDLAAKHFSNEGGLARDKHTFDPTNPIHAIYQQSHELFPDSLESRLVYRHREYTRHFDGLPPDERGAIAQNIIQKEHDRVAAGILETFKGLLHSLLREGFVPAEDGVEQRRVVGTTPRSKLQKAASEGQLPRPVNKDAARDSGTPPGHNPFVVSRKGPRKRQKRRGKR